MAERIVLVTGANRGIGLALTRAYLERARTRIVATCRTPDDANDLHALAAESDGRVAVERLDVADDLSIAEAVKRFDGRGVQLDRLILNAGIYPKGDPRANGLGSLDRGLVSEVLLTNAVSPALVLQAFLDHLRRAASPVVVCLSSIMGSVSTGMGGELNAYSISKAALNMVVAGAASELARDGITVVAVHPGWVSTDMGGHGAPVRPTDSAAGIVRLAETVTRRESGRFLDYTGRELPW